MSPLLALRGHAGQRKPRQLSGAKRTSLFRDCTAAEYFSSPLVDQVIRLDYRLSAYDEQYYIDGAATV